MLCCDQVSPQHRHRSHSSSPYLAQCVLPWKHATTAVVIEKTFGSTRKKLVLCHDGRVDVSSDGHERGGKRSWVLAPSRRQPAAARRAPRGAARSAPASARRPAAPRPGAGRAAPPAPASPRRLQVMTGEPGRTDDTFVADNLRRAMAREQRRHCEQPETLFAQLSSLSAPHDVPPRAGWTICRHCKRCKQPQGWRASCANTNTSQSGAGS